MRSGLLHCATAVGAATLSLLGTAAGASAQVDEITPPPSPIARFVVIVDRAARAHFVLDLATDQYELPDWLQRAEEAVNKGNESAVVGVLDRQTVPRGTYDPAYVAILDSRDRLHYVLNVDIDQYPIPPWMAEVIVAVAEGRPTMLLGLVVPEVVVGTGTATLGTHVGSAGRN